MLAAHADHLGRQTPTETRYVDAALIVHHLTDKVPERCGCTTGQRDEIVRRYRAVLDHLDWCDVARPLRDRDDDFATWFTGTVAARLRLRAFSGDQ